MLDHSFHPSSGHHYQRLLYASASILSIALIIIAAFEIGSSVRQFVNGQSKKFAVQGDILAASVREFIAQITEFIDFYELLWPIHDTEVIPLEKYRARLQRQQGTTITESDLTLVPVSITTTLTAPQDAAQLAMLLRLTRSGSPAPIIHNKETFLSGMMYTPELDFLLSWPPLPSALLSRIRTDNIRSTIAQATAAVEKVLLTYSPECLKSRRTFWIPSHSDSLTGTSIVNIAAPIFRDDKRVAVLVSHLSVDYFMPQPRLPGFFVVSNDRRRVLAGNSSDAREAMWRRIFLANPSLFQQPGQRAAHLFHKGLVFFLTKPLTRRITGTDWLAVYAFDWRSIVIGTGVHLSIILATTLSMLILLWSFTVLLDRRVLTPLQANAKRVFDSETFNRTVVATAPVGLSIVDAASGEIIAQNEIAASLLDGQPQHGISFYQTLLACEGSTATLADGQANNAPCSIEIAITHADGKTIEINTVFSRARYHDRDIVLFGLSDISQRKETERLLCAAKQTADQISQAKSMFVAAMSHEIRTPLHGALGNLELLERDTLNPAQKERVSAVRHSFDALLALINNILDLSKLEARELTIDHRPFNVTEVVERCALTFAPLITGKGLRFYCLVDPAIDPLLLGDGHRISQILMNLVNNACKFTERGEITLRADRSSSNEDRRWIRFQVIDSGIGIAHEQQQRIFNRFTQVDQSIACQFGGTGLGLSLCKQLTELMGGQITIVSEAGAGSTFTVDLPFGLRPGLTDNAPIIDQPLANQQILIDCNAPAWRTMLATRFAVWGARVSLADVTAQANCQKKAATIVVVAASDAEPEVAARQALSRFAGAASVVIVSMQGPLHPQRRDGIIHVSAFSTSALRKALLACCTGESLTPAVSISVPELTAPSNDIAILVAEDDLVNRTLLQNQLSALGYRNVKIVANGKQALACWTTRHFDIVLTDLGMPETDGRELLAAIRAQGDMTPVIATTASTQKEAETDQTDFSYILYKPIALAQLQKALNTVLGNLSSRFASRGAIVGNALNANLNAELKAVFAQSWPPDRAALLQALSTGDRQALQQRLHRVRGALAILGESALVQACAALEEQSMTASPEEMMSTCDQLIRMVDTAINQRATSREETSNLEDFLFS